MSSRCRLARAGFDALAANRCEGMNSSTPAAGWLPAGERVLRSWQRRELARGVLVTTVNAGSARRVGKSTYFFGALGGLLFGYDLGIVAGALLFIVSQFGLSHMQAGMVTSSLLLGAAISAVGCGRVNDRVGRRAVV